MPPTAHRSRMSALRTLARGPGCERPSARDRPRTAPASVGSGCSRLSHAQGSSAAQDTIRRCRRRNLRRRRGALRAPRHYSGKRWRRWVKTGAKPSDFQELLGAPAPQLHPTRTRRDAASAVSQHDAAGAATRARVRKTTTSRGQSVSPSSIHDEARSGQRHRDRAEGLTRSQAEARPILVKTTSTARETTHRPSLARPGQQPPRESPRRGCGTRAANVRECRIQR